MMPDADYLYACDERWWKHHLETVKATFKGKLYTQWRGDGDKRFAAENGIEAVQGAHSAGLGRDKLHFGSNSGYQAINLAYLLGATRIILLGYDMGATGNTHWFGDHPKGMNNGNYQSYVSQFDRLATDLKAEGVEVINCTRQTALYQFERAEIGAVV